MAPLRAEESCLRQQFQFSLFFQVQVEQLRSTFICQHIGRSDDWVIYWIFCNTVTGSCKVLSWFSAFGRLEIERRAMILELPAIRPQDNRHRDSIAGFSLSQTHSFHGKFLWKHWISSRRQKYRSSPSSCLSGAHTNESEWPKSSPY